MSSNDGVELRPGGDGEERVSENASPVLLLRVKDFVLRFQIAQHPCEHIHGKGSGSVQERQGIQNSGLRDELPVGGQDIDPQPLDDLQIQLLRLAVERRPDERGGEDGQKDRKSARFGRVFFFGFFLLRKPDARVRNERAAVSRSRFRQEAAPVERKESEDAASRGSTMTGSSSVRGSPSSPSSAARRRK